MNARSVSVILAVVVGLAGVSRILHAQSAASSQPAAAPTTRDAEKGVTAELDAVISEMTADSTFRPHSAASPASNATDGKTTSALVAARIREEANTCLTAAPLDPEIIRRRPFDEASNRAFLTQAVEFLKDFKSEPPDITCYILDEDRRRPVRGMRLELLARLVGGQVSKIVDAVRRPSRASNPQ